MFTPLMPFAQSNPIADGKTLFQKRCKMCHGRDGTRGFLGAANLQLSKLDEQALVNVITNGRKIMPSWRTTFTPEQIAKIATYVKTLRIEQTKVVAGR